MAREQQDIINKTLPVEQHFCCDNPAFLYRVYQDTEVDLRSFMEVAKDAFAEREAQLQAGLSSKKAGNTSDPATPSKTEFLSRFSQIPHGAAMEEEPMTTSAVRNVLCTTIPSRKVLHIDWDPPWNLQYIDAQSIYYELRIVAEGGRAQTYFSNNTELEAPLSSSQKDLQLWVACVVDGSYGAFNNSPFRCSA